MARARDAGCDDGPPRRNRPRRSRSHAQATARRRDRPSLSRPSDRQTSMNPERLVAGLDLGSAKTTAIIAEVVGDLPKHPVIKVMGVGQARTTGMRRGVVSDIEETTRSIRKALQDAERMAGAQVTD